MLSKHDELFLRDLKLQPEWLHCLHGQVDAGFVRSRAGVPPQTLPCVGGGFLIAPGAAKLVNCRMRSAGAGTVSKT